MNRIFKRVNLTLHFVAVALLIVMVEQKLGAQGGGIEEFALKIVQAEGAGPESTDRWGMGKTVTLPRALEGAAWGQGFGNRLGDYLELPVSGPLPQSVLALRYWRNTGGIAYLKVSIGNKEVGRMELPSLPSIVPEDFAWAKIAIPELAAGDHRIRFTLVGPEFEPELRIVPEPVRAVGLDELRNRFELPVLANSGQLALSYRGRHRLFYSSLDLGEICSLANGAPIDVYPDHVVLDAGWQYLHANKQNGTEKYECGPIFLDALAFIPPDRVNLETSDDPISRRYTLLDVLEQRRLWITEDDLLVCDVFSRNQTSHKISHNVELAGYLTEFINYRQQPRKIEHGLVARSVIQSRYITLEGNIFNLIDKSLDPSFFPNGLTMGIGCSRDLLPTKTSSFEKYQVSTSLMLEAGETSHTRFVLGFAPSVDQVNQRIKGLLSDPDAFDKHRWSYAKKLESLFPKFECSNNRLQEFYQIIAHQHLLAKTPAIGKFRGAGFLECRINPRVSSCYSGSVIAHSLNWATDRELFRGHVANLFENSHEDGSIPWYVTPFGEAHVDHESRTGVQQLIDAAWSDALISGQLDFVKAMYPSFKREIEWWLANRDQDSDGAIELQHFFESESSRVIPYDRDAVLAPTRESVEATVAFGLNLRAMKNIATLLGKSEDAARYGKELEKVTQGLDQMWSTVGNCWSDRIDDQKLLDHLATPFGVAPLALLEKPTEKGDYAIEMILRNGSFGSFDYVPSVVIINPESGAFIPVWDGYTLLKATGIDAALTYSKQHARSRIPQVSKVLQNHLAQESNSSRPFQFVEGYDALGAPIQDSDGAIRDRIPDLIIRHVVGVTTKENGEIWIDPVPVGLSSFQIKDLNLRGGKFTIRWRDPSMEHGEKGLTVELDGEQVLRDETFQLGGKPMQIPNLPPIK